MSGSFPIYTASCVCACSYFVFARERKWEKPLKRMGNTQRYLHYQHNEICTHTITSTNIHAGTQMHTPTLSAPSISEQFPFKLTCWSNQNNTTNTIRTAQRMEQSKNIFQLAIVSPLWGVGPLQSRDNGHTMHFYSQQCVSAEHTFSKQQAGSVDVKHSLISVFPSFPCVHWLAIVLNTMVEIIQFLCPQLMSNCFH